jgi:hypothetical protein
MANGLQWLVDQSPQGGCEKNLSGFAMQSFARFWSNTNAFFDLSKKGVVMRVSNDVNRRFDP